MAQTAPPANGDSFQFEVVWSESEWKAPLPDEEYKIRRQGDPVTNLAYNASFHSNE